MLRGWFDVGTQTPEPFLVRKDFHAEPSQAFLDNAELNGRRFTYVDLRPSVRHSPIGDADDHTFTILRIDQQDLTPKPQAVVRSGEFARRRPAGRER